MTKEFRRFSIDANLFTGTIYSYADLKDVENWYEPQELNRMREHETCKGTFGCSLGKGFTGVTLKDYLDERDKH